MLVHLDVSQDDTYLSSRLSLFVSQEPDAGKVQADDAEDKTYEPTGTDQAEAAAGQNEEIPEGVLK